MKLRSWFCMLAAPPLLLLLVLLAAAIAPARNFLARLDELRGDGEALVALQRFAASVDREVSTAELTLGELELGMRDSDSLSQEQKRRTDSVRVDEQRLFRALAAGLEIDRRTDGRPANEDIRLLAHADSTSRIVRARADSALDLGSHARFREARTILARASDIDGDAAMSKLRQRLTVEEKEVARDAARLAKDDNMVIELTLGTMTANRLAVIADDVDRLTKSLTVAQTFHELTRQVVRLSSAPRSNNEYNAAATRASSALDSLVFAYHSLPLPPTVVGAREALAHVVTLHDSAAAGMLTDSVATISHLRRALQLLTNGRAAAGDSVPDVAIAALRTDLAFVATRARTTRVILVLLAIGSVALAIGAPVLFVQRVITPIRRLTQASARVSDGDFNVRITSGGVGEVAELSRSFAQMASELGLLAVVRSRHDVELRESEARQRALAERLAHLLATGPAVVFNLSLDAPPRAWFVSDNVFQQLGYAASEFTEDSGFFFRLLHPDDRAANAAALHDVIVNGSAPQHYRLRHIDGTYRWLQGELRLVRDENNAPMHLVGSWIDVTDAQRTAEIQQLAREAAEATSRAKSDFLANMSHEIRTPMNGVMGMLELALDAEMPPEQREYLQIARSSAESLLGVINDVLDYSKIEAGQLQQDRTAFRLTEVLEDTLAGLALRAHSKGLELALHVEPEVPEAIVADSGRIRQVIVNLIGNAIKFTDRGEVVLHVAVDSATVDQTVLRFEVSDTGIGIAASKHQAIFEAFAQADSSTTRQYGGTGLGLAIVSSLVTLMGGEVSVDSVPKLGSTFRFTVPAGVATLPAPSAAEVPTDLNDVRVLVVDDNATNRMILQNMLTRWGMRPTVVDSGAAALALLRGEEAGRGHFALLLVDAQMPQMDGFGFVEYVRADSTVGQPAIMMLSSATFHDDVRRCREMGIDLYLTKPVRAAELRAAIGRLLVEARSANAKTLMASVRPLSPPAAKKDAVPLRVLLAEDNAVNRRLALALLERRGALVATAVDGRQAIDAWGPNRFDVVLMDIQMPELDGLEVTRMIRSRESAGEHVPIIALTARAMPGDREQCLAAGMDAYISKPLRPAELMATIDRLVAARRAEMGVTTGHVDSNVPVLDWDTLRENTNNDDTLAAELIAIFQSDAPIYMRKIRSAIDLNASLDLQQLAHTLKGAAASIAATAVAEAAQILEENARTRLLENSHIAADALAVQLALLDDRVNALGSLLPTTILAH